MLPNFSKVNSLERLLSSQRYCWLCSNQPSKNFSPNNTKLLYNCQNCKQSTRLALQKILKLQNNWVKRKRNPGMISVYPAHLCLTTRLYGKERLTNKTRGEDHRGGQWRTGLKVIWEDQTLYTTRSPKALKGHWANKSTTVQGRDFKMPMTYRIWWDLRR